MLFAVLVAAALVFSTFGQGRNIGLAERHEAAMETRRGDGKGMPWSPDTKPRMGPRGIEPEIKGCRHKFGGVDHFDGRRESRGGNRFSGRHGFEGGERFYSRHKRGGNLFNGKHGIAGELHFKGEMINIPMRGYY